ncbi:MAG: HAD-IA family hydrolase [Myxococcota bacterium]
MTRREFDAVLFDLDGVLTDTARLHAEAWRRAFDPVLKRAPRRAREPYRPFDPDQDYARYVDGRDRMDGARSFLASRDIRLPEVASPQRDESLAAVVRAKDADYLRLLGERGIVPFPGAVRWLETLARDGLRLAVVSASHHAREVLEAARIASRFDVRVDGVVADALGLAGKPEPDLFLEAARRLGVMPGRAVVVEDAVAGVAAGRRGGFGFVIGVSRGRDAARLRDAGADLVVDDLGEMLR